MYAGLSIACRGMELPDVLERIFLNTPFNCIGILELPGLGEGQGLEGLGDLDLGLGLLRIWILLRSDVRFLWVYFVFLFGWIFFGWSVWIED